MNESDLTRKEYIGDGVYAGFDGYHIVIWADRGHDRHWIGLESEVFSELIKYRGRLILALTPPPAPPAPDSEPSKKE